jgi:murein DD-endopeptidase MepM/ murein hydrolase activator NlpD
MSRSQNLALFLVIAAVVVIALVARPAAGQGPRDSSVIPAPSLAVSAIESSPAIPVSPTSLPQGAPMAATPLVGTAIQQAASAPAADSIYAAQLQVPGSSGGSAPVDSPPAGWNPPPMEVPLARHPFDHYWLIRPVASNSNNFGLAHYAYGSDGPADDLRIHHGIDLANPIGVEVLAAGAGTVVSAGRGHITGDEAITAYGNTVVIQHDFGYNGQPVFTLYAHLSALLVEEGQRVDSGQVIALIGNTGQVTGPHVHFEVRIGHDRYSAVRNPDLWIAPYVGAGVLAGRVVDENGQLVLDASITVIDLATGEVIYRTAAYAATTINSDDNWQETFTVPDMPAGRYLVTARHEQGVWTGQVEVLPGMTNWVELERSSGPTTEDEDSGTPSP